MASPGPRESKLFAREIAAFSDAELDRYLEEHRLDGPDGSAAEVEVEDPGNLPESFIERLRDRAQNMSDAVQSKALNLNQLNARLLAVDKSGTLPQAVSRPHPQIRRTPSPAPYPGKELETERYKRLVDDGGPPPYPIEFLDQVFQNPEEYHEMLRPWHEYPDNPPDSDTTDTVGNPVDRVFEKARERWRDFREWQRANRGLEEDGFHTYVEEYRRKCEIKGVSFAEWGNVETGDYSRETEAEQMAGLKKDWDQQQFKREYQRRRLREHYGVYSGAFAEYVEEAKRRLARNGFTRAFELDEDPRRQDKLTTWIEYLDFEYAWYERHARSVKRQQLVHDEAWKKLVATGVLRPHETDKSKIEPAFQLQSEEDGARKAVEATKSAARSVYTWAQRAKHDPGSSEQERIQRMIEVKAKVDAAEETMKSIKRRNDLISEFIRKGTWNYETATRNMRRQSFLLQWILEKIEAELNEVHRSNGGPHAGYDTKRRPEGDKIGTSGSRRRKQGNGEPASISDQRPSEGREMKKMMILNMSLTVTGEPRVLN